MKKTLAAVLAAAMALSTATVALAKDNKVDEIDFTSDSFSTDGIEKNANMGSDTNYVIRTIETENGLTIDGSDIAKAMKDGLLTASVVVTSNQSKLNGRPTITAGNTVDGQVTEVTKYVWATQAAADAFAAVWNKIDGVDTSKIVSGDREITFICTKANGDILDLDADIVEGVKVVKKGTKAFETAMQKLEAYDTADYVERKLSTVNTKDDAIRLSFKINHTYGVDDVTVKMKMRFTAKKDVDEGTLVLPKGDTLTSIEVAFKAGYNELLNYYEDMQLTKTEVSDNNVILNGEKLYDAIGDSKFTITFGDDIAMFEGKSSAAQKKINLYYNTNTISAVQDKYPDIDFTYLTFMGNPVPSFQNTGKLYFAAENNEYTVYEWDGEYLTPVSDPSTFDKTYKTVTVKNVKRLGSYVISPVILPEDEEPEEPAEPVDSTPVAEPDDEGENPNTGAC